MTNPIQNPTAQLKQFLRDTSPFPCRVTHQYSTDLSFNPPAYLDATLEDLQYIKHQPFVGRDELTTIQLFKTEHDAYRHYTTQKSLDPSIFIQPQQCVKLQGSKTKVETYVLIFNNFIRDLRVWVSAHANLQASDKDLWQLVKKVVRNIRYLSTEIQAPRSHGNLEQGIGITEDLQVYFFNLGATTNTYLKDVQEFDGILKNIQQNLVDSEIKDHVNKLRSFFSDSCLAPNPIPVQSSHLHNTFNPDHVKLIFNYPSGWNDDDCLRFLANMHQLCKDKRNINNKRRSDLSRNPHFRGRLRKGYTDWDIPVTATNSALNEVYQFGIATGNYVSYDRNNGTWVLSEASIVSFSHNCIKHFVERAQDYNNNLARKPTTVPAGNPAAVPAGNLGTQMLPELISYEILGELRKEFPYLIEDIYEAFHVALANGYTHHCFTVSQILTGRL